MHADLGKAAFEGYATELGLVYDEINTCVRHLSKWARPRRVPTPLVHFHSTSKVYPSPLGVVLVLSPWNYPVQLALVPLVDAIAAGNCVALKPSRTSKATSELLIEMLAETCSRPSSCAAFPGSGDDERLAAGSALGPDLLHRQPERGARHHGGSGQAPHARRAGAGRQEPLHRGRNGRREAAPRSASPGARASTAGQTCVAPDYFLVHENVADDFVAQLDASFQRYYGENILAVRRSGRT